MTVAIVMSHPANMPGFKKSSDLSEVHSLSSYTQAPMVPSSGLFSFPQTEPAADLLQGTSWGAAVEGSQNFQDLPDSGSSHSGDAEEYIFTSGQTTPKGSRRDHPRSSDNAWTTSRTVPGNGQAMSRVNSSRSIGSSLSHASQLSNLDTRGNTSAFRNGSQGAATMVGMNPGLILDTDANHLSQMYWPGGYGLNMGLDGDSTLSPLSDMHSMHVVPAQIQLGPGSGGPDNSSPGSWDCFSSSISRTSSPATVDDWLSAPLSPQVSPDLHCQSAQSERKLSMEYMNGKDLSNFDDALTLPPPFIPRRPGSEGESARDHALYKNALPASDGLYHCPWEGQACCTHKAEKLKCNYDKFVDSHLKPYRCKAESCENARFSSTACLLRHEREAHGLHGHGEKPFQCTYPGCERSLPGNGFPRQWNLRDHMKRVHNDRGPADDSPPATTTQPQPSKGGRKRKTDAPLAQATSSRKASIKAMPVPEEESVPEVPLIDQWLEHHKAVQDMLRGIETPEGDQTLKRISQVQKRLEVMAQMTSDMDMVKRSAMQAPIQGSYITTG